MTGRHRKDQPCCITVAFANLLDWFLQRISPDFELWRNPDIDNKETK
jgi:hypothetical protein